MDASGFGTLASYFPDRTVVTYDPRGLGRSARHDGRTEHKPETNAEDIHRALGQEATVFPSNHGGFLGGEFGQAGQPEAFAARLREVLDGR